MNPILECHHLTKQFGRFTALSDVSFSLKRGRITGLPGPNGSGKTTLIKLINGLLTPTCGEIRIDGMPVGPETKKIVSYLPDNTYLPMSGKISDIIRLFRDFYEDFDENRAEEMLQALSLNPSFRLRPLSKGTLEKVQLIMVMSRRADLYILDEPIAGVDPAARDFILKTILDYYDPQASILISTHLIADIESILNDVIFLQNGRILLQEEADEIRKKDGKSIDQLFREVFRC